MRVGQPRPPLEWLKHAGLWALMLGCGSALGEPARWRTESPGHVTVNRLAIGESVYDGTVLSWRNVVSASRLPSGRRRHHIDLSSGQLTLTAIDVAGQLWHDVTLQVDRVIDTGQVASTPPWLPDDPLFAQQWHLQNPRYPGEDLNVARAWQLATGHGIRLAVVDDGLAVAHPDLNAVSGASWDFRTQTYGDPTSEIGLHGTAVAGLAAARGHNGVGVTGVAFDARVVGLNLLRHRSDTNDAKAMLHDLALNHIYINSYGSADGTGQLQPAGTQWHSAIWHGVTEGRDGKGAVYLWAAGNGTPRDRADYDGQASHPAVLTIAAVDEQGRQSPFSESGANVLVAAPGGSYCSSHALLTTDLAGDKGFNNGSGLFFDLIGQADYTRCMNGTSAAVPLVAGVVALILEVNPRLTWRDVRAILALTARVNQPKDPGWQQNGIGRTVHHAYGFGVVDAFAAVRAAQTWRNLAPAAEMMVPPVPTGNAVATGFDHQTWSGRLEVGVPDIEGVEHVELWLKTPHPNAGTLTIELTSPSGLTRTFMAPHECRSNAGATVSCGAMLQDGFRFGSLHWLGESPAGSWKLTVTDSSGARPEGVDVQWTLTFRGVSRIPNSSVTRTSGTQ